MPELFGLGPIFDQDASNMPALQRGMKAAAKEALTLDDYQESRIQQFHQLLDRWLDHPENSGSAVSAHHRQVLDLTFVGPPRRTTAKRGPEGDVS